MEEIEEKSKKDIKTKNHEHRKFDQNSSDILPKQRNNEPIFQFPGNFQDRFTNQKNPDPVKNQSSSISVIYCENLSIYFKIIMSYD